MLQIDKAVCLHYVKRPANSETLQKQLMDRNINCEIFRASDRDSSIYKIDYIDEQNPDISKWRHGVHKDRHYNAFRCHQKIISNAKKDNLQNILMLEDDAYITDRFDTVVNNLDDELSKLKYDIIYFGWWILEENDWFNNKLEKDYNEDGIIGIGNAIMVGGLHGALINHTLYDTILNMPPVDPIDCQLNVIRRYLRSFYIFPKVIHVRNMPSHCDENFIVRNNI